MSKEIFSYVKLKDVADVEISSVDKKCNENETEVSLCNFVDVYYNWAITERKAGSFMKATAKQSEIDRFALKKGQVAITKDSETKYDIGVATYIADDFDNVLLGYHCALITPNKNKLSGKYLNAFFHTKFVQKYFELNATGSGQRFALSLDVIKDMPIYLPSLSKQEEIAEIFSKIDRKIELNETINDNLEQQAKLLYDYWFVQFNFPNKEGKPYKSNGGQLVYNNILKRKIPPTWYVTDFQQMCNIRRGASPRPIDKYMDKSHKGMPWVKISDATSNNSPFLTTIKEHIICDGIKSSVHVTPNTLIVSNSATPGIPKFIQIDACVHDGWLILDKYPVYYKYFLYYVIKMIRKSLNNIATGSIFKNLNTDYLKEYKCIKPEDEIIIAFNNKIEPIMNEILILQKESENLCSLRNWLLPVLINGQATIM